MTRLSEESERDNESISSVLFNNRKAPFGSQFRLTNRPLQGWCGLYSVDKTSNKVSPIDVAVPWDSRAEQKEQGKRDKYQDLRSELRGLWDKPVEILLIIIRY